MSNAELQKVFLSFCDVTKKGSTTATDKTIKKICTDAKIYSKKLDINRVDIEFRKCIGNAKKDADFPTFVKFLENNLAKVYAEAAGISDAEQAKEELKNKIVSSSPQSHSNVKVSNDEATKRLTDVKNYTGAHKERFDAETGAGKGKDGRVEMNQKAAAGYVGGYKNMGAYEKK